MTDWPTWFRYQLQASADGFVWGLEQLDSALHEQLPPAPDYMGTWQPARHLWHVTEYDRCVAIPSMRQWFGEAMPAGNSWDDSDEAWSQVAAKESEELIAAFREVRQAQLDLLDELVDVDWQRPQTTLWGHKPLAMVVTKTFQHTYEHGDTLLRMALWWGTRLG